jgi:hypothetical protein
MKAPCIMTCQVGRQIRQGPLAALTYLPGSSSKPHPVGKFPLVRAGMLPA